MIDNSRELGNRSWIIKRCPCCQDKGRLLEAQCVGINLEVCTCDPERNEVRGCGWIIDVTGEWHVALSLVAEAAHCDVIHFAVEMQAELLNEFKKLGLNFRVKRQDHWAFPELGCRVFFRSSSDKPLWISG